MSQSIEDKIFAAETMLKNKDFAGAANLYSEINDNQKNNEIIKKQALTLYNLGKYSEAIKKLELLLNRDESFASINLSRCYAKLNENEKALAYLKQHLQSRNKESEASIKLETAFNQIKNDEEWKKLWLKDWYTEQEIEIEEAKYYIKNNKNIEALENLDNCISKNPNSHEAFYLRASIFYELQDYKNASKDIKTASNLEKNNKSYLFLQAEIANKQKKYTLALENYNLLLKIDKYNQNYYIKRAETYSKLENYSSAIEDIDFCLKYDTENNELKNIKAKYQINLGETWEALITLNQLIAKDSKPDYFLTRGLLYAKTNNTQLAFKDFSQAIDYDPTLGEAYFQLGLLSLIEKNKESACYYLKTAIKLGIYEANEVFEKNCQD